MYSSQDHWDDTDQLQMQMIQPLKTFVSPVAILA